MGWYNKYLELYDKEVDVSQYGLLDNIKSLFDNVQSQSPVVSVVMIAYNEEKHILASLWSLVSNISSFPYEILIVDNNSTDSTADILKRTGIPFYSQPLKGPGHARNMGLEHAKGKYIVCIDSDTLYPPKYIETMVKALDKKGVAGVYGLWSYIPDKKFPRQKMFFYEFLRDVHLILLSFKSPERCVRGMVFAHRADHAREIGYKTNIKRGEDGYLAYRLKDYGKLRMILSLKARPYTSTATIASDGSFVKALVNRIQIAIKGGSKYFFKTKGEIKDQESNLL
ncbi:MAG: glycosyltransferase family A protein [Eubacteriales bacterium]|jgi:glycosyltransferase involved in cell wall biosynthesis|nr:glycosyltransferase family A protein [Eubacteriales bacterium]MDX9798159.1 glycosyltransferase family A protein [Bacteroidales bacterium]